MCEIKEGQELRLENVLSIRKKMTQTELQQEMTQIGNFIQQNNLIKSGPVVSATFSIEQNGTSPILDMEILVPLDKDIPLPEPYRMKKIFHLKNAIHVRHEGNPQRLQNTLNGMVQYIQNNKLQQITPAYNATVNEPKPGEGLDKLIIDAYIGVNPSIL
ncbi:MAG: AraC family transcriptional regulator [Ruminiclostridium sp.]|nr:AraC family transcriptional regulator [Ruminiclostridium sp.]